MRMLIIGAATACAAVGCAGPGPFADRGNARAESAGVNAQWLEELYRSEIASHHDDIQLRDARDAIDSIDASSAVDDLVAHAIRNHPAVQAAYAEWQTNRERIIQQRTLPEPQVSYGVTADQVDSGGWDPVAHRFGVSQMFPWFGELDQRADVASEAAEAALARLLAAQADVARNVKQAYAEYAFAALAKAVVNEHDSLLESMEEVVRIRYRAAEVSLADLLRVEQERDRIEVEGRNLDDLIGAASARLNAAAGRPAEAPLPSPQRVARDELERVFDEPQLLASLAQRNPQLAVLQRETAGRREAIALSRLAYYPDFMLGIEYGVNTSERMARMMGGGSDALTGRIAVNLPIWRDSYDAAAREALAAFGASTKRFSDRRNVLEADLKMALYQYRDAQRRVELFGDVLRERGEQTLEATLSAYRAGEATFTDLIQVQRELLEFELAHERAIADAYTRLAEIESLLGGRIIDNEGTTP